MYTATSRKASSLRDTWFRTGGFTSTLTVPVTPDGALADKVKKNLDKGRQPLGTRIKVLEDGGISAQQGAVKSNPFPRQECARPDCLLCFQKDGEDVGMSCEKCNVGYEAECSRCPARFAYIGETSRTAYTRLKEHLGAYRAAAAAKVPAMPNHGAGLRLNRNGKEEDVKSWMWEHSRDHHGGVVGAGEGKDDYKAKVTGKFQKCLQRQVDEDIRMQVFEKGGGHLSDSKKEYYTAKSVQTIF